MNVKMKRYLKALVAFVLAFAMVSEAWGGLSFVSEAETSTETEVSAQAENEVPADAVAFPVKREEEWAATTLPSENNYKLTSEKEFISFARASRKHSFKDKTIYMDFPDKKMDYSSGNFLGIGTSSLAFEGTFEGCGHTITDMTLGTAGMFVYINNATIKNLVIDGATMTGSTFAQKGILVTKAYGSSSKIEGVTIQNSEMTVKNGQSAILVGYANNTFPIKDCKIIKTKLYATRESVDSAAITGYGLVIGNAAQKVNLSGVEVSDCEINLDVNTWASNIGGFVGQTTNGGTIKNCSIKDTKITGSFTQTTSANPNQNEAGNLLAGIDPDKAKISENIGGAIGYAQGVLTVENVDVDNVDITMANVCRNVGGFAGYVTYTTSTEDASVFTNCSVKNADIRVTLYIWDAGYTKETNDQGETVYKEITAEEKHYYQNFAGFVGCIDKKGTFTKDSVDSTNIKTETRYRCLGGLIGSTFTYKKDASGYPSKGIVNVSQCSVTNVNVDAFQNRNSTVIGGLISLLGEGSTVTDCYVLNFTSSRNTNSSYAAGLIGKIYEIGVDDNPQTVVQNCFVDKIKICGYHYLGAAIAYIEVADLSGISNVLHCEVDETVLGKPVPEEQHVWIDRNNRTDTLSVYTYSQITEVEHEKMTNKDAVFVLNAGRAKDIWVQGTDYPVFADPNSTNKPMRKVIFQAEGESFAYYTNAEGKINELPRPDEGYIWWDYDADKSVDENTVFEKNAWVYQVLVDEKLSISNYENCKDTESDFYISNLSELVAFQQLSLKYTFEDKTIHLLNNLDMSKVDDLTDEEKAIIADWPGIGTVIVEKDKSNNDVITGGVPFGGTFDGHNYIISNFEAKESGLFYALGFVPKDGVNPIAQATVKNFTLDHATMVTNQYGRALVVQNVVGKAENSGVNSQVLNVHVTNSTIKSKGGACGIIVGLSAVNGKGSVTISGCTATKCTMTNTAAADTSVARWGFIMGRDMSGGKSRIVGCTATDCDMISENVNMDYVGGILGDANSNIAIEECIVDGCTIDVAPVAVIDNEDGTTTIPTVQYIGGIVGQIRKEEVVLRDCTVTGTTITLDAKASKVGLGAGGIWGGTIDGIKINNSQINSTFSDANNVEQSKLIGGVVGAVGLISSNDSTVVPSIEITGCELEGNTISIAGIADSVGGLVGKITEFTENATIKDSVIENITITNTHNVEKAIAVTNIGGAIGCAEKNISVSDVDVKGVAVTAKRHIKNVGGFIGCVTGEDGSVFEDCQVTGTSTITMDTGDWNGNSYNVSGFAGLVEKASTFTLCFVRDMNVSINTRCYGFGGIVGTVGNPEGATSLAYAIIEIDKCEASGITLHSRGNSKYHGGIIGLISEGSSISNCLVSGFKYAGGGGNTVNIGSVMGRVHDTASDKSVKAIVKNCYIHKSDVTGKDGVGIVVGQKAAELECKNIYYYDCVITYTGEAGSNNYLQSFGTEITGTTGDTAVANLTNKKLAYNLNTTNGTEPNSGSWAQGYDANGNGTHPIIADDEHFPVAYVTYLRYNNDALYGGMEYLKFPIKGNGEIDYYNGERTFIRKTDITDTNQVNRQTDTTQEPIELYKKDENGNYVFDAQGNKTYQHYRETTETSAYTLGTEPTTNGGRLWEYPEGEIRTDVTITQLERTAWDYNGDTELTVADLVRRKKVEKSGVNSSLNKACVLGTTLTNEGVDESKASNWSYDDNSDLDPNGYLPSYRLRRVILTPPSTEVSVLSYNLFYTNYAKLDDNTRREAVKDLLGLYRGDYDSYNGGTNDGVFNDYTTPKADIIALQEVTADYWHETLYQNYMAPFQTGNDNNNNKRLDPDEVTSKRYYTYKHVGRGRYGHVFFDENNGQAYADESYSVIFYDQTKYEYAQNKGLSGTIYFSDTPTVASYGWGNDTVNSLLDSQRAANWAIFTSKATGESFMFVNVHLSHSEENSSGDYVDRKIVREKQMELLTRKIKETLAQESRQIGAGGVSGGMPVIIAGDFNAYIGVDAYSYALEQGYEDARESAVISSENHGAYTKWTETDETKYAYGDHIFVNKRAEVQTYEVIDEEGDLKAKNASTGLYDTGYRLLTGTDGKQYHMSDHCPIKATIDIGTDYIRSTTVDKDLNPGLSYGEILGLK